VKFLQASLLMVLALALGWMLHAMQVPAVSGTEKILDGHEVLRPINQVDRYRTSFFVPREKRRFEVNVLAGTVGEILVVVTEMQPQDSLMKTYRRKFFQRKASSWEPVFYWIDAARTVVVTPETSWAGIHRDTGLGLSVEIMQGSPLDQGWDDQDEVPVADLDPSGP
jgi:beta-lactamase superfamily II metal-dependent hydrolase